MKLSAQTLNKIDPEKVIVPEKELLQLPEKVLQFVSGARWFIYFVRTGIKKRAKGRRKYCQLVNKPGLKCLG